MKRIVFMGTPDFAVPVLQALAESDDEVVLTVTQPDRPKGRKKVLTPPPVKAEAEKLNIPIMQPEKIANDYEEILKYNPDVIVTAAYGQILPQSLLEEPKYGCINVHASLLPELRGGAPIHYAIMQGKKETGITIMYMVEKLDAGDIISQRSIPIEESDHVGSMHDKLADVGADLLMETLPALFAEEVNPIKQDDEQATFARNITREQEKIDWTKSHEAVYNHIRGLHPWPVAFTTFEKKNLKVWWAEKESHTFSKKPGEIVALKEDGLVVVCGDGKGVRLTELQPAGKKKMKANDFLQGYKEKIKPGMMLGD